MSRLVFQYVGGDMKYEPLASSTLDYHYVTYGNSRIQFRGPAPDLDKPYTVFLGGIETFGKFLRSPFPNLVSTALGTQCLNLGCTHAGPDVYLNDASILELCNQADQVFIQIPSAHALSNRFYKVHPRRNDRFVAATVLLRSIYLDVDFTEFSFTRHMLQSLHRRSPDRFDVVLAELQAIWHTRLVLLMQKIKTPKTVLWFARHSPDQQSLEDFKQDPLFVNRAMVDDMAWYANRLVEIPYRPKTKGYVDRGLIHAPHETPMTQHLMGQAAHMVAADMLIDEVKDAKKKGPPK